MTLNQQVYSICAGGVFLQQLSEMVIKRRKAVLILALILCILSLFAMQHVKVNYDLASYLPESAPSTKALKLLGEGLPNLQVYVPDISPQQALEAKEALKQVPGVQQVMWLDDVTDLRGIPFESLPADQVAPYYAKGGALFQLTADMEQSVQVFDGVRAAFPASIAQGEVANQAQVQSVSMGEISSIMIYVLPLLFIILLLSTRHWVEPLLFLLAIGVAIVLNEGTNIIFGQVSFVTQACSAVLQLAVSIDYAVFLLHRFAEFREEGMDAPTAMKLAMQKAASAIAASAMTTVFGFLALLAMRYGMGRDMGIVLAKGVLLSYVSVMVVLPAAAITFNKLIDRTAHRSLMPSFEGFGRVVVRYGAPLAAIMLVLLIPSYMGQKHNEFLYGSSGMHGATSSVTREAAQINQIFGRNQSILAMVPEGEQARNAQVSDRLKALPYVRSVVSYAETVGVQIPPLVLPDAARSMLTANGHDLIILTTDLAPEGDLSFAAVQEMRGILDTEYGNQAHLLGESVVNYDLKDTITADNLLVLLIGVLAIGMVLLITFRNVTIPLILLVIIEGSIWLNMAIPYFLGNPMNYIGYQIVSSVQLGATVDYGILLCQRYMEARQTMDKRQAAAWALSKSTGSILPPMMILTLAGYTLYFVVVSNGVISQMGEIIGRGAAVSGLMVLLVLPTVLVWCDKLIMKTRFGKREVVKE